MRDLLKGSVIFLAACGGRWLQTNYMFATAGGGCRVELQARFAALADWKTNLAWLEAVSKFLLKTLRLSTKSRKVLFY